MSWKGESISERALKGGPSGMSAAFVPGRIRCDALSVNAFDRSREPAMGDLGPSWSSAIGGGLGRRGELEGEAAMIGDDLVIVVFVCIFPMRAHWPVSP